MTLKKVSSLKTKAAINAGIRRWLKVFVGVVLASAIAAVIPVIKDYTGPIDQEFYNTLAKAVIAGAVLGIQKYLNYE